MYYLHYRHDINGLIHNIDVVTQPLDEYARRFFSKEEANLERSILLAKYAAMYAAASHRLLERKD